MAAAFGYAANHSFTRLKPLKFDRPPAEANDVDIEILYCGVCHSDVDQVENDWSNTVYPCMPGHEIVGRVTAVGGAVTKHAVGDLVGVGCMVDSCRQCESCKEGLEQFCTSPNSWLATYNGPFIPAAQAKGQNIYGVDNTYGGYSTSIVVKQDFVLKIPASLPVEKVAPILCAGVTTYSPLRHWKVKAGDKVGIVGIGGLGSLAIKLVRAMGAEVHAFTRDNDKVKDIEELGAKAVLETDEKQLEPLKASLDFILSTIPEAHKVDPFIPLLKRDGTYCSVGALAPMPGYNHMPVIIGRKSIAGSLIGGIAETQEVLDFCAEHAITPETKTIRIQDVNRAFKEVKNGEIDFRYVIDMSSLREEFADEQ